MLYIPKLEELSLEFKDTLKRIRVIIRNGRAKLKKRVDRLGWDWEHIAKYWDDLIDAVSGWVMPTVKYTKEHMRTFIQEAKRNKFSKKLITSWSLIESSWKSLHNALSALARWSYLIGMEGRAVITAEQLKEFHILFDNIYKLSDLLDEFYWTALPWMKRVVEEYREEFERERLWEIWEVPPYETPEEWREYKEMKRLEFIRMYRRS